MKKKLLFLTFVLGAFLANAQLTIDSSKTATQLVQNVLLGNAGVTVSNVAFTGPQTGVKTIAQFGGNTNIGLSSGILICTGILKGANGPQGPNNKEDATFDHIYYDQFGVMQPAYQPDPPLEALVSGSAIYDNSILEFDFVPQTDSIKFRYVFASEEYPEYVCSQFNDVFGFFLSGPKPGGGTYTNQNIAIIPGTVNTPVAINTVNGGSEGAFTQGMCPAGGLTNTGYYFNNGSGATGDPLNGTTIQYDGFTKVLTARAKVTCGQTYHIRISIADVNDEHWDSGVFLEAGSFTGAPYVTMSSTGTSCFGAANGTASVSTAGLTGPFSYSWNTGATTSSISGIAAGVYTVSVINGNGCTQTATVQVTQPAQTITATVSATNNSCYYSCIGAASASASGGTGPYSYSWSNGATTANISNLCTGNYTLTTTDVNGCTASKTTAIATTGYLVLSANTITNATCTSPCSGAITTAFTGGATPYTYSWNNGSTTKDINNLCAATYTLITTDANGCTDFRNITVTAPTPPNVFETHGNMNCAGTCTGSINITTIGSNAPFTYSWNNGATIDDLTALCTGTYSLTVTDNLGCTATKSATITAPTVLTTSIDTLANVNCPGGNNGYANVLASGGSGGYSYTWDIGYHTSNGFLLPAATYTVTVHDTYFCTSTITFTITEPAPIVANASAVSAVSCYGGNNGSVTANPNGGNGGYTYLWMNNNQTTTTISNLTAATYTVIVTDSKGCTGFGTVSITQPLSDISISITASSSALCGQTNGSATVSASGGTNPLSYSWNTGSADSSVSGLAAGSYTVTVTDNNTCTKTMGVPISSANGPTASITSYNNVLCAGSSTGTATVTASGSGTPFSYSWSSGSTGSNTVSSLLAGNYSVTITDVNSCITIVPFSITEPTAVTISNLTATDAACGQSIGAITYTVSGGVTPYTYSWSNGNTNSTISNLGAGAYTITLTDNNNCSTSASATVNATTAPTATINALAALNCFGDANATLAATPSGGNGPYSYSWSNGTSTAINNNLTATTYSVLITDINNCTTTASFVITQPTAIVINNLSAAPANCGNNDGSASVSVAGGTSGYTYTWSGSSQTTSTVSNLAGGIYTVVVNDANNCSVQQTFTITNIPGPSLAVASVQNVLCKGGASGTAAVTVASGTTPYTYSWSNTQSGANALGLIAGIYTVLVTDANNCSSTSTITITEPLNSLDVAIATVTNVNCYGDASGAITSNVTGGTSGYTYSWSGGINTPNLSNVIAAAYTLVVTDVNGCKDSISAQITEPDSAVTIKTLSIANVACLELANGSASVIAQGGSNGYSYSWSNGNTTTTISNLSGGIYTVVATDSKNCSVSSTITITQPAQVLSATVNAINPSCNGLGDGLASVIAVGGTSAYTYTWSNSGGQTTASVSGLFAGTYSVIITDANNCITTTTVTLTQPSLMNVMAYGVNSVCAGELVTVGVSATGGTGNYSYTWNHSLPDSPGPHQVIATNNTTYQVTVNDGCSDTTLTSIVLTVNQPPTAYFTDSLASSSDVVYQFTDSSSADVTLWNWSFGDGTNSTLENPTHLYTYAGTYTVTLITLNASGCPDTLVRILSTEEKLVIPNIFSPNNDGKNDGWIINGFGLKDFKVVIYDRWGLKMFEGNSSKIEWDGRTQGGLPSPDGTYYYIISYTSSKAKQVKLTGYFQLIR